MKNTIDISKLDSAKRELDHATRLFFNFGDVVVIHLVASSAYSLLRDLAAKQDIRSFRDQMLERVRVDKRKLVSDKLNDAYNFFKHADKDGDLTLKFNPVMTEYVIWDACEIYKLLTKEHSGLIDAYRAWFYVGHKDIILDEVLKKSLADLDPSIDTNDRKLFLELAELIENKKVGVNN